ncbi:MAG: signal transduction histidine kinase, partial [Myxococcaceae bacterium]|nr:signal transduction histidine kinase [Myxococcaceae bacterium]
MTWLWLCIAALSALSGYQLRLLRGARRERERLTRELTRMEALLQAETRMRALAASLDDAIVIADSRGDILEWNRPASRLFGYEASEVVGVSVGKLIGGEDMPLADIVAPLAADASDLKRQVELLAVRKNGSVFQCELSGSVVRVDAETLWVLIFRDMAERTRAQLALQQSEEKYRALAVHAPVGILEADAAGACTFVNRRWTEITGITYEEALGAGWAMSIHPEDAQNARLAWREASTTGTPFAVDCRYIAKSGRVSWVHGASVPLKDASGVTIGYMASMIDVTERRRTLDALAKSEANFRSLVERAPFGVLVIHSGKISYANDTYLSMLGYENLSELAGRTMLESVVHPDSRKLVAERERAREAGAVLPPTSVLCVRRDGSQLFMEGASTPIVFDGLPCHVFVVRDVTDRERAEQVRLTTERATRESLREKEVLLKEIHHRVKNNLQVIVSLINLQASKLEDPATRAAFEETRSRVHAIALLHERLYGSKNLGRIDMRDYLCGLASDLSSTNVDARVICLHVEAEDLYFEMDAAV